MSYANRHQIDNRANSALLTLEGIIADRRIPAAVRLLMVAERMESEPILTDGCPDARSLRRDRR